MHYNAYSRENRRSPTSAEMRRQASSKRDERQQPSGTTERFGSSEYTGSRNSRNQSLKSDDHRQHLFHNPIYRQRPVAVLAEASGSFPRPRSVDMNLLYEEVLTVQEIDHVPSLMERYEEKSIEYDQGPLRIREETVFEETDPLISEDIVNEVHLVSGVWKYVRTLRRSRSERRMFKKLRKRSVFSRNSEDDADRKEQQWDTPGGHERFPRSSSLGQAIPFQESTITGRMGPRDTSTGYSEEGRPGDLRQEVLSRRAKRKPYKPEDAFKEFKDTSPTDIAPDHSFGQTVLQLSAVGHGQSDLAVGQAPSTYPRFVTEITLPAQNDMFPKGPVDIPVKSSKPDKTDSSHVVSSASPQIDNDISASDGSKGRGPATIGSILSWHHDSRLPEHKEAIVDKAPSVDIGPNNLSNIVSWHIDRDAVDAAKGESQVGASVEQIVRWHTTTDADDRVEARKAGEKPADEVQAEPSKHDSSVATSRLGPGIGDTALQRPDAVTPPVSGVAYTTESPKTMQHVRDQFVTQQEEPLRQPISIHHVAPVSGKKIPNEETQMDTDKKEKVPPTEDSKTALGQVKQSYQQSIPSPPRRKSSTNQESPSSYFFRHKLAWEKAAGGATKQSTTEPEQQLRTKSPVLTTPANDITRDTVNARQSPKQRVDVPLPAASVRLPSETTSKETAARYPPKRDIADSSADTSSTEASQEIFYEVEDLPFDKPKEGDEGFAATREAKIVEPDHWTSLVKEERGEMARAGETTASQKAGRAKAGTEGEITQSDEDQQAKTQGYTGERATNGEVAGKVFEAQKDPVEALDALDKEPVTGEGVKKIIEAVRDYPSKLLKRIKPQRLAEPEKNYQAKILKENDREVSGQKAKMSEPKQTIPTGYPHEDKNGMPRGDSSKKVPASDDLLAAESKRKNREQQPDEERIEKIGGDDYKALVTENEKPDSAEAKKRVELNAALAKQPKDTSEEIINADKVGISAAKHHGLEERRGPDQVSTPDKEDMGITEPQESYRTALPVDEFKKLAAGEPPISTKLEGVHQVKTPKHELEEMKGNQKTDQLQRLAADKPMIHTKSEDAHPTKEPTREKELKSAEKTVEQRKEQAADEFVLRYKPDDAHPAVKPLHVKQLGRAEKTDKPRKELAADKPVTSAKPDDDKLAEKPEHREKLKSVEKTDEQRMELAADKPVTLAKPDDGELAKMPTHEELKSVEKADQPRKELAADKPVTSSKLDDGKVAKKATHEKQLKGVERDEQRKELAADKPVTSAKLEDGKVAKKPKHEEKLKSVEKTGEQKKELAADKPVTWAKPDDGKLAKQPTHEELKSVEKADQQRKELAADKPVTSIKRDDGKVAKRAKHEEELKSVEKSDEQRKKLTADKPVTSVKPEDGKLAERPTHEEELKSVEKADEQGKDQEVDKPTISIKRDDGEVAEKATDEEGLKSAEKIDELQKLAAETPVIPTKFDDARPAKRPTHEKQLESSEKTDQQRKELAADKPTTSAKPDDSKVAKTTTHEEALKSVEKTDKQRKEPSVDKAVTSAKPGDGELAKKPKHEEKLKSVEKTCEQRKEVGADKPVTSAKPDDRKVAKPPTHEEALKSVEKAAEQRKEPAVDKAVTSAKPGDGELAKKPKHEEKLKSTEKAGEQRKELAADKPVTSAKPDDGKLAKKPTHEESKGVEKADQQRKELAMDRPVTSTKPEDGELAKRPTHETELRSVEKTDEQRSELGVDKPVSSAKPRLDEGHHGEEAKRGLKDLKADDRKEPQERLAACEPLITVKHGDGLRAKKPTCEVNELKGGKKRDEPRKELAVGRPAISIKPEDGRPPGKEPTRELKGLKGDNKTDEPLGLVKDNAALANLPVGEKSVIKRDTTENQKPSRSSLPKEAEKPMGVNKDHHDKLPRNHADTEKAEGQEFTEQMTDKSPVAATPSPDHQISGQTVSHVADLKHAEEAHDGSATGKSFVDRIKGGINAAKEKLEAVPKLLEHTVESLIAESLIAESLIAKCHHHDDENRKADLALSTGITGPSPVLLGHSALPDDKRDYGASNKTTPPCPLKSAIETPLEIEQRRNDATAVPANADKATEGKGFNDDLQWTDAEIPSDSSLPAQVVTAPVAKSSSLRIKELDPSCSEFLKAPSDGRSPSVVAPAIRMAQQATERQTQEGEIHEAFKGKRTWPDDAGKSTDSERRSSHERKHEKRPDHAGHHHEERVVKGSDEADKKRLYGKITDESGTTREVDSHGNKTDALKTGGPADKEAGVSAPPETVTKEHKGRAEDTTGVEPHKEHIAEQQQIRTEAPKLSQVAEEGKQTAQLGVKPSGTTELVEARPDDSGTTKTEPATTVRPAADVISVLLEILNYHAALNHMLSSQDMEAPDSAQEKRKSSVDLQVPPRGLETMGGHQAGEKRARELHKISAEHGIASADESKANQLAAAKPEKAETSKARKRRTATKKMDDVQGTKEDLPKERASHKVAKATEEPSRAKAKDRDEETSTDDHFEVEQAAKPEVSLQSEFKEEGKKRRPVEADKSRGEKRAASPTATNGSHRRREEDTSLLRTPPPEGATSIIMSDEASNVSLETRKSATQQLNGTPEGAVTEAGPVTRTEMTIRQELPAVLDVLSWHKGLHKKPYKLREIPPVNSQRPGSSVDIITSGDKIVAERNDLKALTVVGADSLNSEDQSSATSGLASILQNHEKLGVASTPVSKRLSDRKDGESESSVKNLVRVISDIVGRNKPERQPEGNIASGTMGAQTDLLKYSKVGEDSDLTEFIPVQELDLNKLEEEPPVGDNGYFELLERRCHDSEQFAPTCTRSPTIKHEKLYDWSPMADLSGCAEKRPSPEAGSDVLESGPPRADFIQLPNSLASTPDTESKCEGLFGPIYGEYATGYKKVFGLDDSTASQTKPLWEEPTCSTKEAVTESDQQTALKGITQSLADVLPAYDHAIQTMDNLAKTMDKSNAIAPSRPGVQRDEVKARDDVAKPESRAGMDVKGLKEWLTSALQYSAAICWWSTEGKELLMQYYRKLSEHVAKEKPVSISQGDNDQELCKERSPIKLVRPTASKDETPPTPTTASVRRQVVEPPGGSPAKEKGKEVLPKSAELARVASPSSRGDKQKHQFKKPTGSSTKRSAESHPTEPPSKIPVPVAKKEVRKDAISGSQPVSSRLPARVHPAEDEGMSCSPHRHKHSSPLLRREQQLKCSYQRDLQMLRDLNSELADLLQGDEAKSKLRRSSPSFKAGASEVSSSEAPHESKLSQRERTVSSSERSSPFEASSAASDADSRCRHRGKRQKWKKPDIKSDATLSESYSKISASRSDDHRSTSSEAPPRKTSTVRVDTGSKQAETKPILSTPRPTRNISTETATKKLAQLLPPFCYALPGKLGFSTAPGDVPTAPQAPARLQAPAQAEQHSVKPVRQDQEETSYDSPFDSLVPRFLRKDADSPQPNQASGSGRTNDESKPRLRQRRTDNGKSPSSLGR